MKLNLGDRRSDILRGVYEENLRIVNKHVDTPKRRPRILLWPLRGAATVVVILMVVAGFQFWQQRQAQAVNPFNNNPVVAVNDPGQAALSAAERMAREFNSPTDPALTGEGLPEPASEVAIASLFNLQVKTIVIDPGHGGSDPGAIGHDGTQEKNVTLDVARRLQRRLERLGFETLLTREDDRKVSLHERVDFANERGADLFLSIHVNALPAEEVTSVETYYFGLQSDAQTLRLAALENEDSEFSMAEFQNVIEKVGTTMKFQESKQLAASIQSTLYRNMRQVNSAVSDWGVKRGPFVVLLGVEVPSVLAEISVISNRAEEAKLNTPGHRETLAMSLEKGIVNYLHPQDDTSEPIEGATAHGSKEIN